MVNVPHLYGFGPLVIAARICSQLVRTRQKLESGQTVMDLIGKHGELGFDVATDLVGDGFEAFGPGVDDDGGGHVLPDPNYNIHVAPRVHPH